MCDNIILEGGEIMSWYSDGEPFDEFEPEYCKRCHRGFTKAECDRRQELHKEMEREAEEGNE